MATVRKTAEFAKWERRIKDKKAQAIIEARIERVAFGLVGDVRSIGEGVSEIRIHYGPGYRVYYTRKGGELIILLCGGDKGCSKEISERPRGW